MEVKRPWHNWSAKRKSVIPVYRSSSRCLLLFRPLSDAEDMSIVQQISDSGARFLFVGLGCPKQEEWIIDHRGRIPAVMLGVGAAFDFLAGSKPQAPRWMMRSGLEWVFRLACEPRRLWARYLKHNPRFGALFLWQWMTRATPGAR